MNVDVLTDAPVVTNPSVLGGTAVFPGTRVPVKALFDYLEGGHTLEEFLDHFPSVDRELALAVIRWSRDVVINHAHSV